MTRMVEMIGYEECFNALTAEETVDVLDRAAVVARGSAFGGNGAGTAEGQTKVRLPSAQFSAVAEKSLMFGHMGFLPDLGMCVKTGVQIPENRESGLDTVQAAVLLFDAGTGVPQALIDGRAITIMRTAGALVAGIREVLALRETRAEQDSRPPHVAVIGYGAQGRHIARLARAVLHADTVRAFNRSARPSEHAVEMTDSVAEAVIGADVIACATSSTEPVLSLADIRAGQRDDAHDGIVIGSLNSYEPDRTEIDPWIIGESDSVHIDVGDSLNFGPVAHWKSELQGRPFGMTGRGPRICTLGLPRTSGGYPQDYLGKLGMRTVLIGGHGLQDALLAWSVLRGWSVIEELTRRYTDNSRG